jgi:hypothetical protein
MIVMQGSWTIRLEMIAGSRTRLDYISFDTMPSSGVVGGTTWGSIKRLYR